MATEREKAPRAMARAAGLKYVTKQNNGIRRRKSGKQWRYIAPDNTPITDEHDIARINALAIPPAWSNVWIAPNPQAHIQATGVDARGRKQYRYHTAWREARDATKYERMAAFGAALPTIRAQVERDLALRGMPREKVLATVVRLLETTCIRVGNAQYAAANKTYGLTTLRNRHVVVQGGHVEFRFTGKSGVFHEITLNDKRLARIIKQCRDMPGELFSYYDDDGSIHDVTSDDVNSYLKAISGDEWSAKDFRTWAGTLLAAVELQACESCDTKTARNKQLVAAVKAVAKQLGNTPAVCRKCYIHPAVLESYLDGSLLERLEHAAAKVKFDPTHTPEERAVLSLLHSNATTQQAA